MISSEKVLGSAPSPSLDLNAPEIKEEVANKLLDLQICERGFATMNAAYNDCALNTHGPLQFWQKPSFVIGEFVFTFSATILLMCLTHLAGTCP
jgi:hypothetical protein